MNPTEEKPQSWQRRHPIKAFIVALIIAIVFYLML